MQLADSLNRLGTETAFEVLARAKALEASGRRIIHLQIGEPDFTTPRHIIDAGRKAWADGETHYCPAPGLPVLREACAAHLSQHVLALASCQFMRSADDDLVIVSFRLFFLGRLEAYPT